MSHLYENVNALADNDGKAELKIEQDKLVESICLAQCASDEMSCCDKVSVSTSDDGEAKPKIEKMKRDKLVESVCLVDCASDEMKMRWHNVSVLHGSAGAKDEELEQNEKNYYTRQRYHRKYPKCAFITIGVIVVVVFIALLAMPFKRDSNTEPSDALANSRGKLVVLTNKSQVVMFDPKTKNSTAIFDTTHIAGGFDIDIDQRIHWTEWLDGFLRLRLKAIVNDRPSVLFDDKRFSPELIVLDHVSENLYVADKLAGNLIVVSIHTGEYALLMSDLVWPREVVLDPEEGLMFISGPGSHSIIRARMDGTERITVVSTVAASLTLDPKRKRLYWINNYASIESSSYDGNDRRLFFKNVVYTSNIAIIDGTLYWFRSDFHPATLFSCEIGTNHTCEKHANYTTTIFGNPVYVRGYSSTHGTFVKSPCELDNGGCQQLCLLAGINTRSCACRMGWQMNPDKRSCREVRDFVLYPQGGFVRVNSIDGATKDLVWPTPCDVDSIAIKGKIDFDYDLKNDDFYWSDDIHIYKMKLKKFDGNSTIILSINEPNTTLQDIAYDWYTGNVYFVQRHADRHSLMMFGANLGEKHRKTLMTYYYKETSSLHACPYALSLHPADHLMFYACWGFIQRATMNNTSIGQIHSNFPEFKHEYRLVAVDYAKDRIYWIWHSDLVTIIKHSNFDGSDVRVISVNSVKNGQTIDVHERWLYIGNSTSIWRVDKETGKGALQIASHDGWDIGGFKVVSEKVHVSRDDNHCAEGNGGCEQFCLSGKDGPVCMCEDYMIARGFTCSRD